MARCPAGAQTCERKDPRSGEKMHGHVQKECAWDTYISYVLASIKQKTLVIYTILCPPCGHQSTIPVYIYVRPPPFFPSRSPRWTCGSPRMLLALVREFESRRGEILNLFAKKKRKKIKLPRAPSVGKHSSTRVDEGRKS